MEVLTDKRVLTNKNNNGVQGAPTLKVKEYGDGVNHITKITLNDFVVGSPVAAADLAFGALLYTLPAGAQIIEATYLNVALKGTTNIVADTPDVGIGSVIASGAVAVLGGTPTFEDYVTGQTSGAISGANFIEVATPVTAGVLTGIALNISSSTKSIYLNAADGWAGAGDVVANGEITIVWKTVS